MQLSCEQCSLQEERMKGEIQVSQTRTAQTCICLIDAHMGCGQLTALIGLRRSRCLNFTNIWRHWCILFCTHQHSCVRRNSLLWFCLASFLFNFIAPYLLFVVKVFQIIFNYRKCLDYNHKREQGVLLPCSTGLYELNALDIDIICVNSELVLICFLI